MSNRIEFSTEELDRLSVAGIYYDTTVPHLAVRVSPKGKKAFIFHAKIRGESVKRNLGVYPDMTFRKARLEALTFQGKCNQAVPPVQPAKPEPIAAAPVPEPAPEVYPVTAPAVKTAEQALAELTVAQALDKALDATDRGKTSRAAQNGERKTDAKGVRNAIQDWKRSAKFFCDWLAREHPEIALWREVGWVVFNDYLLSLRDRHCAPNTCRLYMNPLRQTGGYMQRATRGTVVNVCQDFTKGIIGANPVAKPSHVPVKTVLGFLDYLRENALDLEAPVALQGLAGLAVAEVVRLTWNRVDLKEGTVTVSGVLKNQYRERTIPVCARVLEALKRGSQKPLSETHVAASGIGCDYDNDGSWQNYAKRVSKLLSLWSNGKTLFPPKDLRNCLPTLAAHKGVLNIAWEQYIGHSPNTVSGTSYISDLTPQFRKLVVSVIEEAITEARAEIAKDKADAK